MSAINAVSNAITASTLQTTTEGDLVARLLAQNTQLVGIIHEQNVTISEMRRTIDALNGRIQELERRQSSNYLNTLIVPILPTLVSSLTSCLAGRTAQPLTTSA